LCKNWQYKNDRELHWLAAKKNLRTFILKLQKPYMTENHIGALPWAPGTDVMILKIVSPKIGVFDSKQT
jgi:hypothetical protein